MAEENISLEFRSKNIDEIRYYLIEKKKIETNWWVKSTKRFSQL